MSTRTVLVLFAIALGLSVYARIFEQGAEVWLARGRLFPELEPGDIVDMRIVRRDLEPDADRGVDTRPIRLRYEGTPPAWWLVEPIRFIGYHPRVQSIAYDLAEVASVAEVLPEDADRFSVEGDVEISRDGSTILVTIPGEVLFASGSVRIRPSGSDPVSSR